MRKKILIIATLFLSVLYTKAQSSKITDVVNFKTKNAGAIVDTNTNVDAYYIFYEVDKLKNGDREYAIKILDNSLNPVATKKIIGKKKTFLAASAYNNKEMLFLFINFKDKFIRYIGFDKKGTKVRDTKMDISKKELTWLLMLQDSGYYELLTPVDNIGFIVATTVKNKKIGYKVSFLSSTDQVKPWTYNTPAESKEILSFKPIKVNEKYIVALEMSKKSKYSQKSSVFVNVFDTKNGKILFKKPYTKETNPRLITNGFIEGDNIILLGEYFNNGENIFSAKSKGLFIETLSNKGELVDQKKIDWSNQLFKKLQSQNENTKKRSYVYFHEITKMQDGNYYAIGEVYRKTVSAVGLASAILSRGNSGIPVSQLTITNAVVYKFDNNFNLKDLQVFTKGKSRAPSITDFGSPQLNAHALVSWGAFDFINLQTDVKKDRFYANFLDYERLKGEKNKMAFVSIVYSDGQLSSDNIYLNNDRKFVSSVLPAKVGNVLLLEYNKKEKIIKMHLEKINIE